MNASAGAHDSGRAKHVQVDIVRLRFPLTG